MSEIDELLKGITGSLQTTKTTIDELINTVGNEEESYPQIIQTLLGKSSEKKAEGVSLLSLKNNALVSYLNHLALIVLCHLERLEENASSEEIEETRRQIIERSIVQRVTLEKGIKPLEKKLAYQLDKMVRAYNRMEADEQKIEEKLNSKHNENSEDNEDDEEENDDSSEEEDDALSYRPDAAALAKLTPKTSSKSSSRGSTEESKEKYKPPKISAVAPPTSSQRDPDAKDKGEKNRKLQSMEEYLREQSDLPMVESSIGSTIVDHGRGGVKTQHDKQKEAEIQKYEESNFLRLPNSHTKKTFHQKQRDAANTFGGEDWSMFRESNNRSMSSGTSRKRKPNNAWDRAKKRRT
ncbi:nucleolar protein required for ribosomal RNA processing [Scheffersomyces xylosifermentans]|uniref:nucleolar protein required for ribosomal RNA processing n=1 Tax=Scheffersomyces xylosifermentans TaxID=1304137 RepID=UPI00315D1BD4